jgi:hypothetical protein
MPSTQLNQGRSTKGIKQGGGWMTHFSKETKHNSPFNSNLILRSLTIRTSTMYVWKHSGTRTWNNLETSCHFAKIPRAKCAVWIFRYSIFKNTLNLHQCQTSNRKTIFKKLNPTETWYKREDKGSNKRIEDWLTLTGVMLVTWQSLVPPNHTSAAVLFEFYSGGWQR